MGKPPYAHRPIGPVDAGGPFDAVAAVDPVVPVDAAAWLMRVPDGAPHLRQNRTEAGRPPQILHSSAFQEIQYAHV